MPRQDENNFKLPSGYSPGPHPLAMQGRDPKRHTKPVMFGIKAQFKGRVIGFPPNEVLIPPHCFIPKATVKMPSYTLSSLSQCMRGSVV